MSEDFSLENLVALNFTNLSKSSALKVLEARNAVREFMLTRRKISEVEHFRFIESLREAKNMAYFAVYEVDSATICHSATQRHCPPLRHSELSLESEESKNINLVDSSLVALAQNDEVMGENSAFLGVICLNNIDLANKNATLGIYSVINAHNGAKLLKILRFIAFSELNLHILYAKVLSTNTRAIRFYQKSGFVRCGAMIEAIKDGEKFIDLDIWALKSASLRDLRQQGEAIQIN